MTEPNLDDSVEALAAPQRPTPAVSRPKRTLGPAGKLLALAGVSVAAGALFAASGVGDVAILEGADTDDCERTTPDFPVDQRAKSVGKPNAGQLVGGVHLPASPAYIRRTPRTMWGSGQTIASLQRAIASFRRNVDSDGELILGDISIEGGGPLHPHASHQAGRDVDIWLPTFPGVFKPEHLDQRGQKPRRPMFDEIDWHATWGLMRALLETDAVERVFLERRYQEFVVGAALEMGATRQELDMWFQWPRPAMSTHGIVRHSAEHRTHLHVRFKCAQWEPDCGSSLSTPATPP